MADDVRAIMDDVGTRQAVLLGFSEGAAMSALFAATYPERVSDLILFGGYTRSFRTEEMILERVKLWGTGATAIKGLMPTKRRTPTWSPSLPGLNGSLPVRGRLKPIP
jgi:pimeloyl-ACP methyl ester carboxylesterase